MGFILSYISLILFVIVYLLDEIVMLFVGVKGRKWYQLSAQRKYTKAFTVDVFGNYLFGDFWNFIWSKGGYKFGIFGETLSSVLGRKKIENSLNFFGKIIYYALYAVDFSTWSKGGHCFASIMTDKEINEFLKVHEQKLNLRQIPIPDEIWDKYNEMRALYQAKKQEILNR